MADAPRVVVVDDADALAKAAAERLVAELRRAIDERGEAHLALTGGSTATGLYRALATGFHDALDWSRVHLWWGDERFVPVDHPESNAGLAYAALLSVPQHGGQSGHGGQGTDVRADVIAGVPVRAENVHPYGIDEAAGDSDAGTLVAERYADELERYLPTDDNGMPAFDVVLLGVGTDGHILSCFPGSEALSADAPLVVAIPAPEHIGPHLPRLTLNPRLLEAASAILVMAAGSSKAGPVARALAADGSVDETPARLARRATATWFLDSAAAARLDQPTSSE